MVQRGEFHCSAIGVVADQATTPAFFHVSLHGDALGQIARFIDIAATQERHVIRKQLKRHDGQKRLHDLRRIGDRQEYIR